MTHQGRLIVVRHGQTMWSQTGQYTGRTNIPITTQGQQQAIEAGERLQQWGIAPRAEHVFVSPLLRAQQTAKLLGFADFVTEDNLAEWDYGPAEGRTRGDIARALGTDTWNIWDKGPLELPEQLQGMRIEQIDDFGPIEVVAGRGESSEEAAVRVQAVIDKALPIMADGHDVVCVAHAHILRILTMQWLGLQSRQAALLRMDTAHFGVLDTYRSDRVIAHWNV